MRPTHTVRDSSAKHTWLCVLLSPRDGLALQRLELPAHLAGSPVVGTRALLLNWLLCCVVSIPYCMHAPIIILVSFRVAHAGVYPWSPGLATKHASNHLIWRDETVSNFYKGVHAAATLSKSNRIMFKSLIWRRQKAMNAMLISTFGILLRTPFVSCY